MSVLKLGVACAVMCAAFLVAGLWPFNFRPENDVHWLKGRNGLYFQDRNSSFDRAGGVALTRGPLILPQESGRAISIEIWLQPETEPHGGINHILSFYDGQGRAAFFLGQWKSSLIVRKNFAESGRKRHYREIGAKGALRNDEASFLTITSGEKGTTIYLDGQKVKNAPSFFLLSKGESLSDFSVLLGNSSSAEGAWSGKVFGLAFYSMALDGREAVQDFYQWLQKSGSPHLNRRDAVAAYRFSEGSGRIVRNAFGTANSLFIPAVLPFRKEMLAPLDFSRHSVEDMIVNVLGFMPFGLLLVLWLRETRPDRPYGTFFCAVLIGILVSLVIEVVQVYLPTRDSSQMDLLCNAVGTVAGGAIAGPLGGWAARQPRLRRH